MLEAVYIHVVTPAGDADTPATGILGFSDPRNSVINLKVKVMLVCPIAHNYTFTQKRMT